MALIRGRTRHATGAARLAAVDLPVFGTAEARPDLPPELYRARLQRLRERADAAGYDRLVIYADREHSANLAWLTGFDPRFEEAIAVIGPTGEPAILVGNENWGTAGAAPLPMRRHLHQDLSLPSQPRDRSRPLREVLAEEGIERRTRVGVIGWKSLADPTRLDVPSYLADELRTLTSSAGSVENAVELLIGAGDGLRVINEVDQLAAFEAAACRTSDGVWRVIRGLQPGLTEREAVRLLEWDGSPLSCHLMLTAGPRARLGLLSPGDRRIERGDPFTVAFGIWGALNCRAGWVVADDGELPSEIRDYVDRLVGPYFEAIAEWYGALRVGQTGGALHEIMARRLGDPFFGIFLNAGHQISLDEWVNSPVSAGSTVALQSGMYLQVDVIPATGTPYFTTNIEDGVALADAPLRAELAQRFPDAWRRIEARRDFMAGQLGIDLHPDVLPFSNIPAWLPPFLLDPGRAMTLA
jgi:Xaa-Pro aminopeptidase